MRSTISHSFFHYIPILTMIALKGNH
ncbi:hypothetical protein NC653_040544 [Populus alba x Populus x berolinensis]|uniref:Uncharacterized protein n=1 Tax=Populus alba x Populus x berolinensis TaxID=444605 RepID=A0AAD6PMX2_9ROSI|nr:hypothetical protein NC653_040544 [Populus alba x Populus x berolinensis]